MPRNKDPVWENFDCIRTKNTGLWACCKKCQKEMQGILERLKKHINICQPGARLQDTATSRYFSEPNTGIVVQSFTSSGTHSQSSHRLTKSTSNNLHLITTNEYSEKIKMQIGKYFYATNTPFSQADHPEFKNLLTILRPDFVPPSAHDICDSILDNTYTETLRECKEKVKNKTVCLSLDGWSNVHNEPSICCSITTPEGVSILVDTQDTGINRHSSKNFKYVALNSIKRTEETFGVNVKSVVTDNVANAIKIREELLQKNDTNIIYYACSVHMLNLLAHDLKVPAVTTKIIKVVKYFCNNHLASALYKQIGGKTLAISHEAKWNIMNDSIRSYLDNREVLIKLCQDNKEEIDMGIINIINDSQITMDAVDLLQIFQPIALALERMLRNSTTIAMAVEIWNKLEVELKDQPGNVKRAFVKRRKMALNGAHYVANMLDHRFQGKNLTNAQKEEAFAYVNSVDPSYLPFIMALITQSNPFPKYMFGIHFKDTSPIVWWNNMSLENEQWPQKDKFLLFCEQLMTAMASIAAQAPCLTTLNNQLESNKAAKLAFIFKYLNQQTKTAKPDLSWIST